jgi:hypothetical protein
MGLRSVKSKIGISVLMTQGFEHPGLMATKNEVEGRNLITVNSNEDANADASTSRSIPGIWAQLYQLKHEAPFARFTIVTQNDGVYPITRPRDLALPPSEKGQMLVVWHGHTCTVLKFDDIQRLDQKRRKL